MKKILFGLLAFTAIFSSCTNDDIEIDSTIAPVTDGLTISVDLSRFYSGYIFEDTKHNIDQIAEAYRTFNSNSETCASDQPCYSYYSAATGELLYDYYTHGNICSKGWKIPSSAEWDSLTNIYSTGAMLTANPFRATYAGYLNDVGFREGGTKGYYLSSTSNYPQGRMYIRFDSTSTSAYYPSQSGVSFPPGVFSIRCIIEQ